MADNGKNKQLGSVYLETSQLKKNIDEINKQLASVGKGVSLDVSKQIDEKLEPIKKKLSEIGVTGENSFEKLNTSVNASTKTLNTMGIIGIQSANKLHAAALTSQQDEATRAKQLKEQVAAEQAAFKERQLDIKAMLDQKKYAAKQEIKADKEAQKAAKEKADAEKKEYDELIAKQKEYANRLGERLVNRLGQAEIKLLREQWKAAVEYASAYYDAMNEIRVVTGKTEQEAQRIGETYRKLAKEMKVTSTELSSAAVLFYRQGQPDSDVNKRLEAVTKYAKIANIEFETAAQLVTATTNAMGKDVDRVIDVFLKLGDSAATSGEEIGKGMQKAAAAAAAFGGDFEWLATYIATVSETLRTAPETIGNAFNTMLARMHSIKQNGFNSEDATTLNDVAKALKSIGVELMDSKGNWQDLDTIYQEIAVKWDTMNDKQKSYIATTMAGTRQQNVFFALMNDLSKGIEGGSRAWKLYEEAMNSTGTATQKYAVWQESVTASQENMNRALEDLYANLQPTLIKGFYDGMADLVDLFARGTESMNGMNLVLPLIASGIGALILVIHKANGVMGVLNGIVTGFSARPIIAAVTAFVAVAGILSTIAGSIETAADRYEKATEGLEQSESKIVSLKSSQETLNEMYGKLAQGAVLSSEETVKLNKTLEDFGKISVEARDSVDGLKDGTLGYGEAVKQLNEELDKELERERLIAAAHARDALENYDTTGIEAEAGDAQGRYGLTLVDTVYKMQDRFLAPGQERSTENLLKFSEEIVDLFADNEKQRLLVEAIIDDISYYGINRVRGFGAAYDKNLSDYNEKVKTWLSEAIEYTIQGAELELTKVEKGYLTNRLLDQFIGYSNDGMLEQWEKESIVKELTKLMNSWLRNGFDSEELVPVQDVLEDLLWSIFDDDFAVREFDDEAASIITEALQAALDAGVKGVDLRRIWNSLNEDQLLGVAKNGGFLQEALNVSLGFVTNGDFNKAYAPFSTDVETQSDETKALMYNFLQLGHSKEELDAVFYQTNSEKEFQEALKGAGAVAIEVETDAEKAIPNITALVAEIERAEKAIKNLQAGKVVDTSDLKALVEAHPELMLVIQDAKDLSEALQGIVDNDRADVIDYWAEKAMGLKGSVASFKESMADMPMTWKIVLNGAQTLADITEADEKYAPGLLAAIIAWSKQAATSLLDATKQGEEQEKVVSASETISKLQTEISKIQNVIKGIENGEISLTDILELAQTHTDLLEVVDDVDALKKKLQEIAKEDETKVWDEYAKAYEQQRLTADGFRDWLKNSRSSWHPINTDELVLAAETLDDIKAIAEDHPYGATLLNYINEYEKVVTSDGQEAIKTLKELQRLAKMQGVFRFSDEDWQNYLGSTPKSQLGQYMENAFQFGNVNLTSRPLVSGAKLNKSGWTKEDETKYGDNDVATVQSKQFWLSNNEDVAEIGYDRNVIISITPILPNGDVLTEGALADYVRTLVDSGMDLMEADKVENGGKGQLLNMADVDVGEGATLEETIAAFNEGTITMAEYEDRLHDIQEAYYLGIGGLTEYAEAIQKTFEQGQASANGYKDQQNSLVDSAESDDKEGLLSAWSKLGEMQDAIAQKYPRLVKAIHEAETATDDSAEAFANLRKELGSAIFTSSAKTFTNTAKAVDQLYNHEINAADAMAAFNKESELAAKAQYEFDTATENMKNNVAVTSDQVENLAEFIGYINPDVMLDNWDQVGPMLANALQEGRDAAAALQDALFFTITGTSIADFSNIENGIALVGEDAQKLIDLLAATGMWTIEEKEVFGEQDVWENGQIVHKVLPGVQRYLVPAAGNPFARSHTNFGKSSGKKSSGGGGGGRSKKNSDNPTSSSANQMTEVERMLDIMEQIQKIQEHTRSIYDAQAKYYEATGELQGVIAYYELEKKAIADQNATLEANIKDIEAQMYAKQAEVAAMSTSSEAYEAAANDLEKLQSTHQSYTKELLSNKTEMENLTKAIKKQQDTIRDMEIDLRKTIYQAIEDREALIERKLQGRITLENEILDLIQKRYEKERDLILENSQKQIDALEEERDLLAEQLQLRKEQADEQDKARQLAELEAKYDRIVADPTRRKEALEIQKQIKDLREEMAWDLAEKEVEAQQKSIDDQITSIEDYMEYVKNYYDEMFEHPQKLVAEMESIITQTDEYIIEWLKNNSEEYANVTAARATDMENAWGQMLLDMHGALKLYWDEVESIIEQGDEAIINFLIQNSADYKAVGKLQAEAYVDQWMQMLQKLALAHKQVVAQIASAYYNVIPASTYTGDNSNSSSTGGKKSGGSSSSSGKTAKLYLVYDTKVGPVAYFHNYAEAQMERNDRSDPMASIREVSVQESLIKNGYYNGVRVFKQGGIADFTGPAWLDGTKENPERILSPVQTELFENLVRSLETMAKVRVPSLPAFGGDTAGGLNPVNVGDIIVNVDRLDGDADYEELAEHVFEAIMNRMNRGSVIGGIRF